jgi:hypothetical protein
MVSDQPRWPKLRNLNVMLLDRCDPFAEFGSIRMTAPDLISDLNDTPGNPKGLLRVAGNNMR